METNGPLRVALPDEAQINKSNKTATVKPFQSPNSKNQNKSGMGDVAAVRDNWRPLALGSTNQQQRDFNSTNQQRDFNSTNQQRDYLSEQRRQLAELERMRTMEASGAYRNSRSQSVMPPSGASRPTNHLEVNKMAQVRLRKSRHGNICS